MLPTELGRIQFTSRVESCDKKVVCVESRSRLIYDLQIVVCACLKVELECVIAIQYACGAIDLTL